MGAYDVFISYSHEDKPVADAACAVLERHGVRCWIAPRDVTLGMNYGESIMDAIAGARIMVLIFSDHANNSPQVEREIERAVSKGLWLIPIRIEDVVPRKSLEYFISSSHWLDAITPPMEQHLDRLAEAVRNSLASLDKPPTPQSRSQVSPPHQDAPPQRATDTRPPATRSKRNLLIALLAVLLIAAVGGGVALLHNVLSPKATGSELVLTAATDPGVNAFMPPAGSSPPTNTQPPPTLQPHGEDTTVATQPLPGDRDGLYGGTLNNAECDREKMLTFLGTNPTQAGAFVEALNTDPTLYWIGGHPLTTADLPAYLRELTPVVLRLDTRVTNHGFDGTHPTTLQSVFQTGTAVFVDAHGIPRARCYCGNPLTAPTALGGEPKPVGTAWSGYNPGALAEVRLSSVTITNFVLVDIVTGQPFNRPAGTTGANDTPLSQPVSAPTTPTGQAPQPDIDGTYMYHATSTGHGCILNPMGDYTFTMTHQGNTLTMVAKGASYTGPLNADGSFTLSGPDGITVQGVFATEGIRDGLVGNYCGDHFVATKQ
jgi:hypothetical protein